MIHLICGPIGAGKTAYAIKLAEQIQAIRFSEDEWLAKLFVPDAPEDLLQQSMPEVAEWAQSRYQRCREQIWLVCRQLLMAQHSVILDGAAANLIQRDLIRQKASQLQVGFKLHYVTASADERCRRVFERNEFQGDTYSLEVTPAMFEQMESYFEPPVSRELKAAAVVET